MLLSLTELVEYSDNGQLQEKAISIYYYFNKEGLELSIELDSDVLEHSNFYDQFKNAQGDIEGNERNTRR